MHTISVLSCTSGKPVKKQEAVLSGSESVKSKRALSWLFIHSYFRKGTFPNGTCLRAALSFSNERHQNRTRPVAMEKLLSVMYGTSGIVAALLYLPQVFRYHRDRQACLSISLLSWSGWIVIGVITFLYAAFAARNPLFAAVASLNVIAQSAVLAYGIRARLGLKCQSHIKDYVSAPSTNSGK